MYFENCATLEELKAEYKRLAMLHHPDRGGDLEIMKAVNAEYDEAFKLLKDTHKAHDGKTYTKQTTEAPEEYKNIIDQLIKMRGVVIEIIGCFIWLSGNTKEYKDQIKALGFRWSHNKSMWYKSPAGYKRHGKKDYSINDIRGMYGSEKYKAKEYDEITA